mgnify:FL=1
MCKMNIVVNKLVLGNRELGWELWSGKEVMEYTSKQIKDMIKAGKQKICGLKIGDNDELLLDKEGFFTTNMMVHSHIGSWKSMEEESMVNNLYVCIGSHEESGKVVYDCISSKFEQAKISENDMRAYLKIGIVSGGAKLDGEKIVLAGTETEKKVQVPVTEKKEEPVKTVTAKPETAKPVAAKPESATAAPVKEEKKLFDKKW